MGGGVGRGLGLGVGVRVRVGVRKPERCEQAVPTMHVGGREFWAVRVGLMGLRLGFGLTTRSIEESVRTRSVGTRILLHMNMTRLVYGPRWPVGVAL